MPHTEGLVEYLAEHWSSIAHILYVLGNHEFYRTEIDDARTQIANECAKVGIHLLQPAAMNNCQRRVECCFLPVTPRHDHRTTWRAFREEQS